MLVSSISPSAPQLAPDRLGQRQQVRWCEAAPEAHVAAVGAVLRVDLGVSPGRGPIEVRWSEAGQGLGRHEDVHEDETGLWGHAVVALRRSFCERCHHGAAFRAVIVRVEHLVVPQGFRDGNEAEQAGDGQSVVARQWVAGLLLEEEQEPREQVQAAAAERGQDAQLAAQDGPAARQRHGRGAPELEAHQLAGVDAAEDVHDVVGLGVHAEVGQVLGHEPAGHRVEFRDAVVGEVLTLQGFHADAGTPTRGAEQEIEDRREPDHAPLCLARWLSSNAAPAPELPATQNCTWQVIDMAIPTITSIQPARGPSSGQTLVTISGAGMRLPPPPPASGPTTGALPQTVGIRIGAMAATRVLVREDVGGTIATCLTPPGTPGPADILLQNLDGAGQPIAGEAVLVPGAFTYERPALATESRLTRLVRTLLRALKAQVIENVNLTVHTDFDASPEDGLHLAAVARLPALVLAGPELRQNRAYSMNQQPVRALRDAEGFAVHRVPYTVDVGFTLIGITDPARDFVRESFLLHFVYYTKCVQDAPEPLFDELCADVAPFAP
jgi:hypothetical protein